MATGLWADIGILVSLITGTVALTLSLLMWRVLRRSVVGRTVMALTVVMMLFSFYHGIELLSPRSELFTSLLKSITFTAVVLFVALSIRFERGVTGDTSGGEP